MRNEYLLLLVVVIVLIFSFSVSYLVLRYSTKTIDITTELSVLNPTKDTTDLIKFEDCTELTNFGTEWLITGCKDDIEIHLILLPDGKYYMRICGGWTDGREVVQKAKDILRVLGIDANCDLNLTYALMRTESDVQIYNVCGKEMYMSGRCIA